MSGKKVFAAALGAVAGAALLASPATAAPSADCGASHMTGSGVVRPGLETAPWSYFWSEGTSETFSFCVDVPGDAEIVAEVRESTGQGWRTVLTAPPGPGDKRFSYRSSTALNVYRLYVTGVSGSGTYQAGAWFSRLS